MATWGRRFGLVPRWFGITGEDLSGHSNGDSKDDVY